MAKMKVQNYKKYNNEYTPSWVKPTDDEVEKEKEEFEKLVYGDKKKRLAKKKSESVKVVKTWSECSKLVLGYQGAIYKGFNTEEEAKAFLK